MQVWQGIWPVPGVQGSRLFRVWRYAVVVTQPSFWRSRSTAFRGHLLILSILIAPVCLASCTEKRDRFTDPDMLASTFFYDSAPVATDVKIAETDRGYVLLIKSPPSSQVLWLDSLGRELRRVRVSSSLFQVSDLEFPAFLLDQIVIVENKTIVLGGTVEIYRSGILRQSLYVEMSFDGSLLAWDWYGGGRPEGDWRRLAPELDTFGLALAGEPPTPLLFVTDESSFSLGIAPRMEATRFSWGAGSLGYYAAATGWNRGAAVLSQEIGASYLTVLETISDDDSRSTETIDPCTYSLPQDVLYLHDGEGFLISGWCRIGSESEPFAARLDASGDLLWTNNIALPLSSRVTTASESHDGSLVLAGSATSAAGDEDVLILNLESGGDYQWHSIYGNAHEQRATDAIVNSRGAIIVVGLTGSDVSERRAFLSVVDGPEVEWPE